MRMICLGGHRLFLNGLDASSAAVTGTGIGAGQVTTMKSIKWSFPSRPMNGLKW